MTTPSSFSPGASDEFAAGLNHQVNPGRANEGSITLNDAADSSGQGLDATSARWDAMTPHQVLRTTLGAAGDTGSDQTSYEEA